MQIRFIGLRDLTQEEANLITTIVEGYKIKFERDIPDFILIVRTKKLRKAGNKQKFSIHTRLQNPNNIIVSQAADWDFTRTIHKSMKKLESELAHKFKTEGHLPK